MSLDLPAHGDSGWDVKLNAALTQLNTQDTTAAANLAAEITRATAAEAANATAITAEATARATAITSAITALVNGAPGALDTLNELAAALTADEGTAATLAALVATKAAIASPTFTGVPAAPTAAPGTNTTQVGTTAFTTAAVAAEATARNAAIATASATSQPLDSDLTTIAALDSTVAGVLSTDGSGWIRKTYAQLKTALALVKGDVGLGNVDNTADSGKPVSTAQQTALDAKMAALTVTAVKTANYALAANEAARFDTTSGSLTGTLPTAPADKTLALVKNVIQGGTNTVTIACAGSDTLNRVGGSTTYVLPLLAQGALLEYRAADATWTIIADDLALSQLDARYALLSTVTTKGDLLAATAAGVLARLGVGANNTVLTADSTAATGIKWATPAGGSSITPAAPSTLDVSAGLVLHLAADNIDGVAAAGAVEVWRDISGRSNHVQQPTSGARPTLQTAQVNGKPCVRFDATDDALLAITASPLDKHLLKPFTFFVVLKAPDLTIDRRIWGASGSGGALDLYVTATTGKIQVTASAATGILLSSTGLTAATWTILEVTYNEVGACAIYLNGTAAGTGTTAATFTPGVQHKIGAASGLDMAEYLIYDRALGTSDRSAIRALLGSKYAITVV